MSNKTTTIYELYKNQLHSKGGYENLKQAKTAAEIANKRMIIIKTQQGYSSEEIFNTPFYKAYKRKDGDTYYISKNGR